MRVLQLGPFPPPHGGVQTHLVGLRDFLRSRDIPCSVVNLTRSRRPDADDVYYPRSAVEVVRLLLRLRYDIVHLHFGGHLSRRLLGLAAFASALPHRHTVLTFHSGGYPRSPAGRTARPRTVPGLILRRLDRIIAVNGEIAELFHRFGVPSTRVRLIPPYALPAELPTTEMPAPVQSFFDTHSPVLVTVGLLEPEYDLPTQIAALGLVRERLPRAGLAIIGSGSLDRSLRSRAYGTTYAQHVLLCGDLPHPVTLRAIAQADVFLRTTLYDGDSIAVREALHLGTPVIATPTSQRPPNVTAVPPSDPASLAAAIDRHRGTAPRLAPDGSVHDSNLSAVLDLYRELRAG